METSSLFMDLHKLRLLNEYVETSRDSFHLIVIGRYPRWESLAGVLARVADLRPTAI